MSVCRFTLFFATLLFLGLVVTSAELSRLEVLQQYEIEYQQFRDSVKGQDAVQLVPPAVWKYLQFPEPVYDENGEIRPHCPTDKLWEAFSIFYKNIGIKLQNGCEAETTCDEPNIRDQYLPTPHGRKVTVDVAFHVICERTNACPDGIDLQRVLGQMQTLNEDFETANVAFNLEQEHIFFHVDPQ